MVAWWVRGCRVVGQQTLAATRTQRATSIDRPGTAMAAGHEEGSIPPDTYRIETANVLLSYHHVATATARRVWHYGAVTPPPGARRGRGGRVPLPGATQSNPRSTSSSPPSAAAAIIRLPNFGPLPGFDMHGCALVMISIDLCVPIVNGLIGAGDRQTRFRRCPFAFGLRLSSACLGGIHRRPGRQSERCSRPLAHGASIHASHIFPVQQRAAACEIKEATASYSTSE